MSENAPGRFRARGNGSVIFAAPLPPPPMPRRYALPAALALLLAPALVAQTPAPALSPNPYPATPGADRLQAREQRYRIEATSLVKNVPFTNVGPTVMGGRIVDVDVSPTDPSHFYVAYASAGVWVTRNGGQSFTPLFDDEAVMTVGDIAVDWARGERVWVGTGEVNSSRSSYAGVGVYVSPDSGNTWQHRGLEDTHHIGRVVLHPADPNTAWVAALGPLYSAGGQRGVFKTTDGGASWRPTLPLAGNVGAVDLVRDPSNPATLYAAAWERTRRAWDFSEAGPGSGIYKSTDGGETWAKLSTEASGLPTGPLVGRIGLDVSASHPNVVYAFVDNQQPKPDAPRPQTPRLTNERLRTMSRDEFLRLAPALIDEFLETSGYPASYTAQGILEQVRAGSITPVTLVEYLEDANANLFNRPVKGAEIYRSDDGGRTWRKTHEGSLDNVVYSYGYYFGLVRVSPQNPDKLYIAGVPILRSDDGGKTWANINGANVHVDHHALWASPTRPGLLVNGNDGGVNVSYDDGATWFKANTPAVGQFYAVETDDAEPYRVYGGLQDNGVWAGPSTYRPSASWYEEGRYPYERLGGGDGMQVQVDTRDNKTAYFGSQFGFYTRQDASDPDANGETVRPRHTLGERPPRFNWQSPIVLSRHNQDVLYFGAEKVYRSLDQGRTFTAISPDLTKGPRVGDVPFGTLTTLSESPRRFGLLYAGSDDGRVHVTRDGGYSWQDVSAGLPPDLWVTRVAASAHAEGRVYATLNGYRWDHMDAFVFASDDYGQTWRRIGQHRTEGLPQEPVNVIAEDPRNPNLLYVGTDAGVYLTLDRGRTFMGMPKELPAVSVHDLKVHGRERDLVVGTHGRSIYVADVGLIQTLDSTLMARRVYLYPVARITRSEAWGRRSAVWNEVNEPAASIGFWSSVTGMVTLRLKDSTGVVLREWTPNADRGLNFARFDGTVDEGRLRGAMRDRFPVAEDGRRYVVPGRYTVEVTGGGVTATQTLEVRNPPPRRRRAGPAGEPEAEREREEAEG